MADTQTTAKKSLVGMIVGAIIWITTGAGAAIVSHFLPAWLMDVLHPLGALIAAISAAFAAHTNTTAVTQNTAAVTDTTAAIKQNTAASAGLTPNPAIVSASQRRTPGSPLQGGSL